MRRKRSTRLSLAELATPPERRRIASLAEALSAEGAGTARTSKRS